MAVVQDLNNNQQNPSQTGSGASSGAAPSQPISTSGSSAAPTIGANTSGGTSAAPTVAQGQGTSNNSNPTSSGRFTNLSSYLDANKGYNAQNGGLAGQINGTIANQGNTINSNVNQQQNQFSTNAQANRVTGDPSLTTQLMQDPTKLASDPNSVAAFQKQLTGSYAGPTQLDSSGALQGQAQNLQDTANLTNSSSGRQALLAQLYGKPSYTAGQQSLDNLFLQGNPSQLSALNQSRNLASNVSQNLNNLSGNDAAQAAQYAQEAKNTNQATSDMYGQAVKNFDQSAQQNATNQQQQAASTQAQIAQSIQNGNLSADWSKALGYTPGSSNYGVDASQYLSQGPAANQYNTLNSNLQAQLSALSTLGGGASNINSTTQGILQGYNSNLGQAGAFNPNSISLNPGYGSAVAAAKGSYLSGLNNLGIDSGNIQGGVAGLQSDIDRANALRSYLNGGATNYINNAGTTAETPEQLQAYQAGQAAQNDLISKYGIAGAGGVMGQDIADKLSSQSADKIAALQALMKQYGQG